MEVTSNCSTQFKSYRMDAGIVANSTSSVMHTMQPVAVDAYWPYSQSSTTSHNEVFMSSVPATQSSSQSGLAGGIQYGFAFPSSQPLAPNLLGSTYSSDNNQLQNSQIQIKTENNGLLSRTTSDGASSDGKTSPFHTVDRFALDNDPSGAMSDIKSPASFKNEDTKELNSASAVGLKPPKRPLTAYMRYSKEVWAEVKQANPDLSVCSLGTIIGKLWHQLTEEQKKGYFDQFQRAKEEYEDQLKAYLVATGQKVTDLPKPKSHKKDSCPSKKPRNANGRFVTNEPVSAKSPAPTQQPAAQNVANMMPMWSVAPNGSVYWSGATLQQTSMGMVVSSMPQSIQESVNNSSNVGSYVLAGQQYMTPQMTFSVANSSATGTAPVQSSVAQSDGMVVFHLRSDGTPECYIQRDHVSGTASAVAAAAPTQSERTMLLNALNEGLRTISELRSQLSAAHSRINELQQHIELLKQLRDADIPIR